jgi:hypothetical protein
MEHNTGYLAHTILIQHSSLTGLPTGLQKPNIPTDPNYVAPTVDHNTCPVGPVVLGAFNDDFNNDFNN